ncbi:MAG: TIGR03905 family TSCPD domain-containing protein [Clostridia bacterium]|nr:TIGR03905 family TSCPD domain-containing protein [Clostridia bacterium]
MHCVFSPRGVCSTRIDFDINDGVVTNVAFTRGCNGNLKAVSKLVDGQTADYIVGKLKGNLCGFKGTSCADQLAVAVEQAAAEERERKSANA